jgi:RNA polymerase sigma-70 factor (ECF subfamily)
VIELNHAVAVSMVDGAARALDLVDSLAARGKVTQYHLLHAARGRFLEQLGRAEEAREAYTTALKTVTLDPERRFLAARIARIQ